MAGCSCASSSRPGTSAFTPAVLRSRLRLVVDAELQPLARLEGQHLPGGDLDAVARLRVAAAPGRLAPDAEVTEPDDLHVFALLEAPEDDVEQRLHHRGGLPLGEPVGRHRIDEVILRQCRHLPSNGIESRTDRAVVISAPRTVSESRYASWPRDRPAPAGPW